MSTSNTALRVTELDFNAIRDNLKTFLRSQSEFTDFDFEGSGMAILLDILAYNTHYMGMYLNMIGNEMFLDTAQLRPSILSLAKAINYVPASKQGAITKLNIVCTPTDTENQSISTLVLDKYTRFLGLDIDGINYPFVTVNANTSVKTNGIFSFANVVIKQGEVLTYQWRMSSDNESRRFKIPSANVDTTTISVRVQESSSNTFTEDYIRSDDITTVKSNSAVYWIEENEDLTYTLYFGDNIIGKKPKIGNIITCTYIDTAGSPANNISKFVLTDAIGGLFRSNVNLTAANSSYGGLDKETIEQVRFRAPYFYTTQNRAVTKNDYETLILKDFNNIEYVSVWGGEENDPVIYGKVFLSLKTRGNYVLTNLDKENIKQYLIRSRNVMTVTPEIVDPDYTYILLKGTINYNPALTSKSAAQILTLVKAAVNDYNNNELTSFNSYFRKSKVQAYIEACEPSITGSDIQVYIQKRFLINTDKATNYEIKYNMPLQKGSYTEKLFSFPELQSYDFNAVSRNIYFEEVPMSATGLDSITILNSGKNYYETPVVTVTGDGTGATAKAIVNGAKIVRIDILTPGTNYTRADITITGDGSGANAIARLEAKTGLIRSYYFKNTGEKVILNSSIGTINYDTGVIKLTNVLSEEGTPINRYYDQDILTLAAPMGREIVPPLKNRIITIDENDPLAIQIEVLPE